MPNPKKSPEKDSVAEAFKDIKFKGIKSKIFTQIGEPTKLTSGVWISIIGEDRLEYYPAEEIMELGQDPNDISYFYLIERSDPDIPISFGQTSYSIIIVP